MGDKSQENGLFGDICNTRAGTSCHLTTRKPCPDLPELTRREACDKSQPELSE
jgi:hypothetical protein